MKEAIIFDLGNVLVNVEITRSLPHVATHLKKEYSQDELRVLLYGQSASSPRWDIVGEETKLFEQYHLGALSTKDFYTHIRSKIAFKDSFTFEEFKKLWPNRFSRNEEVIRLLPLLKSQYRFMLSDTNELDASWLLAAYPDIFLQFDKVFFSFETKSDKYGLTAWKNILQHDGLPPERHVFIDDHEGHVARAKSLGMQGIIFTDAKHLIQELQSLGYISSMAFD